MAQNRAIGPKLAEQAVLAFQKVNGLLSGQLQINPKFSTDAVLQYVRNNGKNRPGTGYNNSILQQFVCIDNVVAGLSGGVCYERELFVSLAKRSPRLRLLIEMIARGSASAVRCATTGSRCAPSRSPPTPAIARWRAAGPRTTSRCSSSRGPSRGSRP